MRDRTAVEPEALFGLLKIAADDISEVLELDDDVRIKCVEVVEADQPGRHVPFVIPSPLIFLANIRLDFVIVSENLPVIFRIFVTNRLIWKKAKCLVGPDGPAHFLVDIGLEQLRSPIAVIGPNEAVDRNVVKKTGNDHLLVMSSLLGESGALQEMVR